MRKCPHCGGSGRLNASYSYHAECYFVFVKCDICGAQTRSFRDDDDPANSDWKSVACNIAVEAWDMRSNDADEELEVKR